MQEVGVHVERRFGIAPFPEVHLAPGSFLPGRAPPLAGSLAGQRDHCVEQHDLANWHALANERRGEASHRLRDHDGVAPLADCLYDDVDVLGQAGSIVVARQVERDHVVAAFAQQGCERVPIGCVAAGARDQHVREAYHFASSSRCRMWSWSSRAGHKE